MKRLNLILGICLVTVVLGAALVSLVWLPYDPNSNDWPARLSGPSPEHWLGADHLARDVLSRLLVGARATLYVGFIAVSIALSAGCVLGAVAGYAGGFWDDALMRLIDTLYAFPAILLALLLAAIYQPGTLTAMAAIGIATIPIFARLMRSSVISLKARPFVEAARAQGVSEARLLWRHILPNALSPIIVQASLSLAVAVLAEAALSFLGLGTPPDVPSWGRMLRDAQGFLRQSPMLALIPGLAIVMTVLGWGLLGDGLRDMLDPREG